MQKTKLKAHISSLDTILQEFQDAKEKGKETNSNEERARSIADIEKVTQKLEDYFQNNDDLLAFITGTEIGLPKEIKWNDIIRPQHFEKDLQEEVNKLKKRAS